MNASTDEPRSLNFTLESGSNEVMDPPTSHRRFAVALLAVAALHVIALSTMNWHVQPPTSRTLIVEMRQSPVVAEPAPAADQPTEIIPREDLAAPQEAQSFPRIQKVPVGPQEVSELKSPTKPPPTARQIVRVVEAAIDGIRARARDPVGETTEILTFSVADFPDNSAPDDPWAQPQYIRKFTRRPVVIRYQNQMGYRVIKRIDEWGNATCFEERGYRGDANPPLFYRIPAC